MAFEVRDGIGRRFLRECIDFLLPQHCLVCGGSGASLHTTCVAGLPLAEGPRCTRCWRPGPGTWCERCATGGADAPAFDGLRTPFRFEGDARRAILEAKFRGITAHLEPLAQAAAAALPPEWRVEAVVGVPLAGARERKRGFNQAALLAGHVADVIGAETRPRLVRRMRPTPPQAGLAAAQRHRNLRDAFAVRGVPPASVLVVDDVTTTGSTLDEVARTLKAAGAQRVYALAVARED